MSLHEIVPSSDHQQESDQTNLPVLLKLLFRVWRVVNTIILPFAFFSPWLVACNATPVTGFDVMTVGTLYLWYPIVLMLFVPLVAGTYGIVVYVCVNTLVVVRGNPSGKKRWLWVPLGLSIFGVTSIILQQLNGGGTTFIEATKDIKWGFWLTGAGLLSSAILEAYEWAAADKQRKSNFVIVTIALILLFACLLSYPAQYNREQEQIKAPHERGAF